MHGARASAPFWHGGKSPGPHLPICHPTCQCPTLQCGPAIACQAPHHWNGPLAQAPQPIGVCLGCRGAPPNASCPPCTVAFGWGSKALNWLVWLCSAKYTLSLNTILLWGAHPSLWPVAHGRHKACHGGWGAGGAQPGCHPQAAAQPRLGPWGKTTRGGVAKLVGRLYLFK